MNEWDGRSMESLTVVHESKLGAPLSLLSFSYMVRGGLE